VGFLLANHQRSVFQHYHDFFELGLVVSGSGLHVTDEGTHPVSVGTAVFVVPGASHGYAKCRGMTMLNCFIRADAAQFDLPWAFRDADLGHLFGPPGVAPRHPVTVELGEDAERFQGHLESIQTRPGASRRDAHDLGHLLLALDIVAQRLESGAVDSSFAIDPLAPAMITAALDLLDREPSRHWSLEELAGELCVGPFHLARQFKRWVGVPPIAYANRRRAELAALLLGSSEDSISSIGAQVGWPDPTHFSRRFRHEHGMTPREYRARVHDHQAAGRGTASRAEASAPGGLLDDPGSMDGQLVTAGSQGRIRHHR
jgi:AraC family L-rhamnose operon transcriptional activator RhaR